MSHKQQIAFTHLFLNAHTNAQTYILLVYSLKTGTKQENYLQNLIGKKWKINNLKSVHVEVTLYCVVLSHNSHSVGGNFFYQMQICKMISE